MHIDPPLFPHFHNFFGVFGGSRYMDMSWAPRLIDRCTVSLFLDNFGRYSWHIMVKNHSLIGFCLQSAYHANIHHVNPFESI